METFVLDGKRWTREFLWEELTGSDDVNAAAKLRAKETDNSYGILLSHEDKHVVGLSKKAPKYPSAAIALALANQKELENSTLSSDNPNWIVLEEVDAEHYWIVVISNGLPQSQYDTILPINEIKTKVEELLVNETYKVYSKSQEINDIYRARLNVIQKGLSELTEDLDFKSKEVNSNFKAKKLGGLSNAVTYSLLGLIVLAVAGYFTMDFLEGQSLQEKLAIIEKQKRQIEQQEQREYEQAMEQYRINSELARVKAVDNVLDRLSGVPKTILNAWYYTVGNMNIGTHGWDLKKIECYYNPLTQVEIDKFGCDFLFNRSGLGTNRMLLQDYPDAKIVSNQGVVRQPLALYPKFVSKQNEIFLKQLPDAKLWGYDMISQLQLVKIAEIDFQMSNSKDITYQLPEKPLTPQEKKEGKKPLPPEVKSLGVADGTVDISSDSFDLVKELADNINFYAVSPTKLEIEVGGLGQLKWKAKFDYFIKTDEGLIGNTGSSGLSSSVTQSVSGNN